MKVEKKGLLSRLLKLYPFHNEGGSFLLIWIEFAPNFGISGCERVLSGILEIVPQNCTLVVINCFIRKRRMYTFEDTQL